MKEDEREVYTLKVELLNGKALLYPIDHENRQYLINKLRVNSDGIYEEDRLSFLWFATTYNRQVIVNTNSIGRIIFDPAAVAADADAYRDNFNVIEKNASSEEGNLPQAIVYHKGNAGGNPLLYSSLEEGCLASFDLELDGEQLLRQFINLIEENGEETFIPLEQIIVMEFDQHVMYAEEEMNDEEDGYGESEEEEI